MKKILAALVLLCIGAVGLLSVYLYRRMQTEMLNIAPPALNFRAARPIYPFSVIPGGVLDSKELADTMSKDPVARKHYQDLKPEQMWTTRLRKPMLAYVSYRKNDKVMWTNHPVQLAANELVLTDGDHVVRARCGNRVSAEQPIAIMKPQPLPAVVTPPEPPPPDIAMNTALPPLLPPTVTPPTTVKPPGNSTPPPTWCCTTTTPPTPVPEPGTFLLVLSGAVALAWAASRGRSA